MGTAGVMLPFDLTWYFFHIASDEGGLFNDDMSTAAWTDAFAVYRQWLVRHN
jgi:hypothetical protein